MLGRVYSGINNIYRICPEKGRDFECRIKGKILDDDEKACNPLAPGDMVEFEKTDSDKGLINARHPRRNRFARWNRKKACWQIVASNIDLLLTVISVQDPPFRPRFVDRVLITAAQGGVRPAVLVNKIDLGLEDWVENRIQAWNRMDITVYRCSAQSGLGLKNLENLMSQGTVALFGPSGVGKSSLINSCVPGLNLNTGDISQKHRRGRHITNFGRLIDMPQGGRLIDTPGVREIVVNGIDLNELSHWFVEFESFYKHCSFQPCTHRHEPGCAVLEAVKKEHINSDRYESYLRIYKELEENRPQ